jgi:hypothetical protein
LLSPKKVLLGVNQVWASPNKISGKIYGKAFEKSRIFSQIKSVLAISGHTIYNSLK